MVKLHLFVHVLQVVVAQHDSASGVVGGEGGDIEDVIVVDEEGLLGFLGVGLDFFVVFECEVDLLLLHLPIDL
jgi:hypothetical protein